MVTRKPRSPRKGQETLEGAIDAADRGFAMFRGEEEKVKKLKEDNRKLSTALKEAKAPKQKSDTDKFWEACGKMQNASMAVMMPLPAFLEWIGTSKATIKFVTDDNVTTLLQWALTFLIAGIWLAGPIWWGLTFLTVLCWTMFAYVFK